LFPLVVGDKSAHEAVVHVPQLFYFFLFTLAFAPSLWIPQFLQLHKIIARRKLLILFLAAAMFVIIKYNTLIHPYMLADNRHYTFYVWNRFYARHELARFAIIPVYIFGLIVMWNSLDGSIGFRIFFLICTIMTLCLQQLIEIRYFLIPFLILRLNRTQAAQKLVVLEVIWNLLINAVTFYLFFTKEIHWSNFDDVQRLIW